MKIEIGAGARAHEGWLAVDLNARNAHVLADATELPFADGSIEEMRAVDVLEHVSYRDTDATLREWARVLAPGAPIYVQVPDAETIMRWFARGDERLTWWVVGGERKRCTPMMGAQWRLLGGHADGCYVDAEGDWRWNAHYAMFGEADLRDAMQDAGFRFERPIDANSHPNLLAHARRSR